MLSFHMARSYSMEEANSNWAKVSLKRADKISINNSHILSGRWPISYHIGLMDHITFYRIVNPYHILSSRWITSQFILHIVHIISYLIELMTRKYFIGLMADIVFYWAYGPQGDVAQVGPPPTLHHLHMNRSSNLKKPKYSSFYKKVALDQHLW